MADHSGQDDAIDPNNIGVPEGGQQVGFAQEVSHGGIAGRAIGAGEEERRVQALDGHFAAVPPAKVHLQKTEHTVRRYTLKASQYTSIRTPQFTLVARINVLTHPTQNLQNTCKASGRSSSALVT